MYLLGSLGTLLATICLMAAGGERGAVDARSSFVHQAGTAISAAPAQPAGSSDCVAVSTADRRVARELADLEPEGPRGHPRLCLLYYPVDGVYAAALLRVDSAEQFRAAKQDAAGRLLADGFDLCDIGVWEGWGNPPPDLTESDQLDQPVECQPRVLPADPGAIELVRDVDATFARFVELTAEQMGWRPNRPLTVFVQTNIGAAVSQRRRYVLGESSEDALLAVREGRSVNVGGSVFGGLILLNLTQSRSVAAVTAFIAHEYTHVAQRGIGGSTAPFPIWFLEGQAVYQEERNAGSRLGLREFAAQEERAGLALHLSAITRYEDWLAREQASGQYALYSRAYAAVLYLIERFGFDVTVALLRDNRDGTLPDFERLLVERTGLSIDDLDGAVGRWLLTAP